MWLAIQSAVSRYRLPVTTRVMCERDASSTYAFRTVSRGPAPVASWTQRSACSLPTAPLCDGIHRTVTAMHLSKTREQASMPAMAMRRSGTPAGKSGSSRNRSKVSGASEPLTGATQCRAETGEAGSSCKRSQTSGAFEPLAGATRGRAEAAVRRGNG